MRSQMTREMAGIDQKHHIHLDIKLPENFNNLVENSIVPIQKNSHDEISDESM